MNYNVSTHSSHLRLPMWLNEGIAMLSVDRFAEKTLSAHLGLLPESFWQAIDGVVAAHFAAG